MRIREVVEGRGVVMVLVWPPDGEGGGEVAATMLVAVMDTKVGGDMDFMGRKVARKGSHEIAPWSP